MILRLNCFRCARPFWQRFDAVKLLNTFPVPNHPRGVCSRCLKGESS